MKTKIVKKDELEEVVQLLKYGEVVAFPTETVYGLAANALDEAAVEKIFKAKERPQDNPLNVLVGTTDMIYSLTTDVPDYVALLIGAFSPGPITYVLKNANKVASNITRNLSTIGIRIPDHPVALNILQQTGLPLAAPSANKSGRPSPTTVDHVIQDLKGEIDAVVDGGKTDVGLESTVVDCTGETPLILRTGVITKEAIKKVVGACHIAPELEMPSSKYKHYTPEVPLILVQSEAQLIQVIEKEKAKKKRIGIIVPESLSGIEADKVYLIGRDKSENARNLYDVLRAIKKTDVDIVISLSFESSIVMDRLKQAATKVLDASDHIS